MSSIIKTPWLRDLVRCLLPLSFRRYLVSHWYECYQEHLSLQKYRARLNTPPAMGDLQDGFLRVYLTYKCNARCWFCDHYTLKCPDADPKLLYDYLPPVYQQIKILSLVGGEVTILPWCREYCAYISREYPHITVQIESNGIAFNEEFREIASENLFRIHFSINAANCDGYVKNVWRIPGGAAAYAKMTANLAAYVEMLRQKKREVFAPSVSMVVSQCHTREDILEFLRFSLRNRTSQTVYYLNHVETGSGSKMTERVGFHTEAFRTIMELERVLAGRYFLMYRLLTPPGFEQLKAEVDELPIEELRKRYADILQLAEGRDIRAEWQERNRIREEFGKKTLSLEEDCTSTLRNTDVHGQTCCFAPWKELSIETNGRIHCCSWMPIPHPLEVRSFVRNGKVEWNRVLNHPRMQLIRLRMLDHDYRYCMPHCTLNCQFHPKAELPLECMLRTADNDR